MEIGRFIDRGLAAGAVAEVAEEIEQRLDRPGMRVMEEPRKDPSKPPVPLGEPGGTTPPYTTGP